MKRLRYLLIDGVLLALPLGAAAYLLYKVMSLLGKLLAPVAHLLPPGHLLGLVIVEIAAFIVLLLILLALGIFARSAAGRQLGEFLEKAVLSKLPGYLIVKSIAADFKGPGDKSGMRPALVSFDDNTVVGLIVEESAEGDRLTVFIPGAPGVGAGNVVLVEKARVQVLDVTIISAMNSMKQRGLGLQQLSAPRPPA